MNVIFVAIALSVFLVGSLISNQKLIVNSDKSPSGSSPLQENVSKTDENTVDESGNTNSADVKGSSDEVTPSPEDQRLPTMKPFPALVTVTPSQVTDEPKKGTELDYFNYPNSETVEKNVSALYLQSADNAKAITDWYKGKIKDFGMSVTSFVTTSTNENILNKLAGAGNGKEINIEIKKVFDESKVSISVSIFP